MEPLELAILAGVSGLMAWVTATLVRWTADARSRSSAAMVLFLFAMMAEMLAGALVYYWHPSTSSLVAGLWLSGGAMSATVFPLFSVLASEARRETDEGTSFRPRPVVRESLFLGVVVVLVLVSETLMGAVFSAAAGAAPWVNAAGAGGFVSVLVASVNSPWFLLTMSAEMLATTLFLRDRLSRPTTVIFLGQSLIMLFSPLAFASPSWVELAVLASSGLMIGLFVYLLEHLYHRPTMPRGSAQYLSRLLAVYGVMMAGLFGWIYLGVGGLFALSVVLEMVLFFGAAARPERLESGGDFAWHDQPAWTFQVLAWIFVAELFMGAVLDLQIEPDVYVGTIPALPLSGPVGTVLLNALSNGFWFFADVTASTWFLVMMGVEMGALVVFKLRESHNLENRVRLLLMMGCYGAFVVFYPSTYFALIAPQAPDASQVPVLGWSMGVGSYPIAPVLFGVILATYAVMGSLSALFGRRAICSTFCSAPLMYQGTAIDSMKSFNRSGPLARKYLSSRISRLYAVTTGVTMVTLVAVSSASYLDSIGLWNVTILGEDPSVFFFAFSFSVLWYAMFVAIPYAGNYNCVTMGWCYTGAVAQAFQKVGVFKLKVRDKQVCRDCTTIDCAKHCPVGLVDMPGHFRSTGEFRSTKCCGVGDCVEVCPYGNLYISDIRHWIRRRMGRSDFGPASPRSRDAALASRLTRLGREPTTQTRPVMVLPMFPGSARPPARSPGPVR